MIIKNPNDQKERGSVDGGSFKFGPIDDHKNWNRAWHRWLRKGATAPWSRSVWMLIRLASLYWNLFGIVHHIHIPKRK